MSVKVLPWGCNEQLTTHINALELRCKGTAAHNIIADMELLEKIEKLMSVIGADRIDISSANRCKEHDKAVGGSGWGMHVLGKALDFKLSKGGVLIDTRLIACYAQELDFNGIGRINKEYIHCDVGTIAEHGGKKWLGDETIAGGTSGSVINEPQTYWQYYGLERPAPKPVEAPKAESIERRLQRALNSIDDSLNLDVDGIFGKLSVGAMKKHNPLKESDPEYIKLVQELLNNKGYNAGAEDGIYGDKTALAMWSACVDTIVKGD